MRCFNGLMLVVAMTLLIPLSLNAGGFKDERAPFDKSSYKRTMWSHANPWFPPDKSRTYAGGGPDFSWQKYNSDDVRKWKEVALRCKPYGLNGLQIEATVDGGSGWVEVLKTALAGFKEAGNGFMAMPFLSIVCEDARLPELLVKRFDTLMPELKTHPNVMRIDGHPVVAVYVGMRHPVPTWREAIAKVEAKHGRMIWLIDMGEINVVNPGKSLGEWLPEYMPVFDGITQYNWGSGNDLQLQWNKEAAAFFAANCPGKIFETAVNNTHTVYFHYGGLAPNFTARFRELWETALKSKADSITLTNFNDTYENSRVFPSYEMDDVLLRISQHELARLNSKPFPASPSPELYLSNYTSVLLGQPLRFEVLGFPLAGKDKRVEIQLDLCSGAGAILHSFPKREMTLDGLRAETFEASSTDFADQRAVQPKLRWHLLRDGQNGDSGLLPQTNIVTSLRPHLLWWTRALKNMIRLSSGGAWSLNDKTPGQTAVYPSSGTGFILSDAQSNCNGSPGDSNTGGGWVRILRNGREIQSFGNWDLKFAWPIAMPNPGGSLDWYNLELENGNGCRYLSPPIWVMTNERPGKVRIPIWCAQDGAIRDFEVEAARVPFFQYDCDRNTGRLLYDASGYNHHGSLGGGHLAYTAYRHEHIGLVDPGNAAFPKHVVDNDGRGCLAFDGNSFAMIQGGTAFPYASTYEVSVKPDAIGKRQGILGAANNQINLYLLEDGRIEASRTGVVEGEGGRPPQGGPSTTAKIVSATALKSGKWARLTVVYDLRKLALYVDGKFQGDAPLSPVRDAEWINVMVLGGTCGFPYNPKDYFTGKIRNARFYGRNLAPHEFLKN